MENIGRNGVGLEDNIFQQPKVNAISNKENITEKKETGVRNSVKLSPTPSMLIFDVELEINKEKEVSVAAGDAANGQATKNRFLQSIGQIGIGLRGGRSWLARRKCLGRWPSFKKILAFAVVMVLALLTGLAIGGLFSMWCTLKFYGSSSVLGQWKKEGGDSKTCTLFEMFAVYWVAFLVCTSSLINIYRWWTNFSGADAKQQTV